jgi:hypothetical protein
MSTARWHSVPGLVARRDRGIVLLLEVERCDARHPEYGRCEAIRNHGQGSPLAAPHSGPGGMWWR